MCRTLRIVSRMEEGQMSKAVYFVLHHYTYEETLFVEVPQVLHKEAWAYITDHTEYAIGAVAEAFVEAPEKITPLEEFVAHDLEEGIRLFWHRLWVNERDFALDDLRALVEKGKWEEIINLVLEIKRREIEASAPYRIYTIPADTPTLSGNPPPGSQITVDKDTAATLDESLLGDEVPVEQILSEKYGAIGELVGDIAHYYTEGRRILTQLESS